jgi:hypothetical protein
MARTQKNKATEYHLGLLKAKLAKLRTELMDGGKGGGAKGEGFDVLKSGDARCALIGFPSVGKVRGQPCADSSANAILYARTFLPFCLLNFFSHRRLRSLSRVSVACFFLFQSTLLSTLTKTESAQAAYEFTVN